MTVLIQLTTAGLDTGPFNLFSDVDNYFAPFNITPVSKLDLISGYATDAVPNDTTIIRVQSYNSLCTNYISLATGITTTTTTTLLPINSVEWLTGDYPPIAFSGGGTSGENIVNLSGTVEIIGTPATFKAYGYWAFLGPATGSMDVSISIDAESRYVDVLTPNINTYSTDLIISAGTYSWSAMIRFFDDANQAGEGGITWTQ